MIVAITENDFWMTADAGWRGPTGLTPTFADIRLMCTAGALGHEELYEDFRRVYSNMEDIVRLAGDRAGCGKGLLATEEENKVILQHRPFIVSGPSQQPPPNNLNQK
jgi:hypothetical protein